MPTLWGPTGIQKTWISLKCNCNCTIMAMDGPLIHFIVQAGSHISVPGFQSCRRKSSKEPSTNQNASTRMLTNQKIESLNLILRICNFWFQWFTAYHLQTYMEIKKKSFGTKSSRWRKTPNPAVSSFHHCCHLVLVRSLILLVAHAWGDWSIANSIHEKRPENNAMFAWKLAWEDMPEARGRMLFDSAANGNSSINSCEFKGLWFDSQRQHLHLSR